MSHDLHDDLEFVAADGDFDFEFDDAGGASASHMVWLLPCSLLLRQDL